MMFLMFSIQKKTLKNEFITRETSQDEIVSLFTVFNHEMRLNVQYIILILN